MPETSIEQKIHRWKPFTGRPAGRRKCRWEDDVRNGLEKMKLIKWTGQVQDRLKRKGIVERAKTVRRCSAIVEEQIYIYIYIYTYIFTREVTFQIEKRNYSDIRHLK
jgi:hypothetical protein